MRVAHLEKDQKEQDLVLSVFHATTHTFVGTTAVKIIENHLGKAFIKHSPPMLIQIPGGGGVQMPPPAMMPQMQPSTSEPIEKPKDEQKNAE